MIFPCAEGEVLITSNKSGFYRAFLPPGDYTVYSGGVLPQENETYTSFESLTVPQDWRLQYNITLQKAQNLEGTVYHDINKNDVIDPKEGLAYAQLTITRQNGAVLKITADSSGGYDVILPSKANFRVDVDYFGFNPFSMGFMNITSLIENAEIKMEPINVTVSGETKYMEATVGDVDITFKAVVDTGSEDLSDASGPSGSYSVELAPGDYRIMVDHNTTENGKPVRYMFSDTLHIDVGEAAINLDLDLIKKIKINGTVNLTSEDVEINFEQIGDDGGAEEVTSDNGDFEIYLVPGEYNVWISHRMTPVLYYVYLDVLNFTESVSLELNLSVGVLVSGETRYDGDEEGEIVITFENNGTREITSESDGFYEVYLPANRTYEIVVNHTKMEDDYELLFTFSGNISVNTTSHPDWYINLKKYLKIKGHTYIDLDSDDEVDSEENIYNVTIRFEQGGNYTEVTTNSTGYYETFLEYDFVYDVTFSSDFPIVDEGKTIDVDDEGSYKRELYRNMVCSRKRICNQRLNHL
jgi:hypothetical protein